MNILCPALFFYFILVFLRLERGSDPLVLSLMIVNRLLDPFACFEVWADIFNSRHILTEICEKTRIYYMKQAKFMLFLVDFVPFLNFCVVVGH